MDENESIDDEDNIKNEPGLKYYLKHKWKLGVTLFCLFSFMTMGIHLEISGSTMLPLSRQIGKNLGELSWIIAARSFGFMITVIFFGIISQSILKHHSELILAIGYLLPTAATALTPYLKSLWTLCIALLLQGMLQGISDLSVNILITRMWKNHSTAPLNCVYLGYAIGALLSIFIVRIFLENDSLINNNKQSEFQSELVGPYTIASIFCLISSIGFGIIAYKQHKRKKEKKLHIDHSITKEKLNIQLKSKRILNKENFWKSCSPTTCGQGYYIYGFSLITILFLFNFFFGGIEQGFTKFFISFIENEKINLNKKDRIYSMIFYWLPMLIGRIFCTFLTVSFISPDLLLTISLLICLITYLLWIIFIWYIHLTRLTVFFLVTLNGLSISSISPTFIGWIKQFLSLSPIELTFILTSNAIGGIIFGLIIGFIYQYYNIKHLFTILILALILCSILFLLSFIIRYFHSNRIHQNKLNQQNDQILENFIQHDQTH